jgi:tRNA(Phe) wybutosine-synthesizing methylase Tyw3
MIHREYLEEKPWNEPAQLTDHQTEELILDLIEKLNKFPEMSAHWTCSGDTLVATARQRLNGKELPIFFICTIRKCLQAKIEVDSS